MQTYFVYRGFDRGPKALIYRASNFRAACAAARKACNSARPTVTVRDCLGGLHAELTYTDERQGDFGREGTIREKFHGQ